MHVDSASWDSTVSQGLQCVPSALLVKLMRTWMPQLSAQSAAWEHTLDAARHRAMRALLVRSTVMRTRAPPAHPAWRASTGCHSMQLTLRRLRCAHSCDAAARTVRPVLISIALHLPRHTKLDAAQITIPLNLDQRILLIGDHLKGRAACGGPDMGGYNAPRATV